jgi:DNA-directed RNA polymerase specialized sigma24 family protein
VAVSVADLAKYYADNPPPKRDPLAELEARLDALSKPGYRSPFKFEPSLGVAPFGTTGYGTVGTYGSIADALKRPSPLDTSSLYRAYRASSMVMPEPTPLSNLLTNNYKPSPTPPWKYPIERHRPSSGLLRPEEFVYGGGGALGRALETLRPQLEKFGMFVGGLAASLENALNALRTPRLLDPYGQPVPSWNVGLYMLARSAFQGDYVARAAFLDEIDADDPLDNVLLVEDLLEPTFGARRTDLRKRWEQETPEEARKQLRDLLQGHKKRAPLEAQEVSKGEYVYEHSRQILISPELELAVIETREDERILLERLRDLLPEQQSMFCWYRSQGLGYEEIAAEMGISVSSVKTHARRAKDNPNLLDLLGR